MPERRLTISTLRQPSSARYSKPRPERLVPFLRLRGLWLEELGFACGGKVRVMAERGRLVIEPAGSTGQEG